MNRRQAHFGIVLTGVGSALMTVDATSQSARTLRDEAPAGDERASYRFIAEKLEEAHLALAHASRRLQDLQLGARRAN